VKVRARSRLASVILAGAVLVMLFGYALAVAPGVTTRLHVSTFTSWTAGDSHTVVIKAVDAGGHVAKGYTGTIHFSSSDPQALLPRDYQFRASDAGVHSFVLGVILLTPGTQSITVVDTSRASIQDTQAGIEVLPRAAAQ
jgi:large repetitive protein